METITPTIELDDQQFAYVAKLVRDLVGIDLQENKRSMVKGRLLRRIQALSLPGLDEYLEVLADPSGAEITEFVDAITTNVTHFFRESHHFDFLRDELVPVIAQRARADGRVRIWSAGCSRGAEPYTIAMTLAGCEELRGLDVKILATDIDSKVLAHGREGLYQGAGLEGLDDETLRRHFKREGEAYRVRDDLRKMVHFKRLNLMGEWPMHGPFDAIFCRNVVIYFDKATQARLFRRYGKLLAPHGRLLLGHSESMVGMDVPFELLGRSIYRPTGEGCE